MRVLPARDAPVSPLGRAEIADYALRLRKLAGVDELECVSISSILDWLQNTELPRKGKLNIETFNLDLKRYRALVTYNPLLLQIDKSTLLHARMGKPDDRYVVAHEIGHVVLHDIHAKPFSVDPVTARIFDESRSAEQQANRFADNLLVPDHILFKMLSAADIDKRCKVPLLVAEQRWVERTGLVKYCRNYDGDACPECLNFTLVRSGTCLKCDRCGATAWSS